MPYQGFLQEAVGDLAAVCTLPLVGCLKCYLVCAETRRRARAREERQPDGSHARHCAACTAHAQQPHIKVRASQGKHKTKRLFNSMILGKEHAGYKVDETHAGDLGKDLQQTLKMRGVRIVFLRRDGSSKGVPSSTSKFSIFVSRCVYTAHSLRTLCASRTHCTGAVGYTYFGGG